MNSIATPKPLRRRDNGRAPLAAGRTPNAYRPDQPWQWSPPLLPWSGSRDVTFYTFQGFTPDGAWYIAARFLVRASFPITPFVPPDPWSESAYAAVCDSSNASLAAALEGASSESFLPSIASLDALVASIRVAG